MDIVLKLLQALWFILPAYVANASPTIMSGKKPLDAGKKLWGERILGSSKTVEGTAGGILMGIGTGTLQMYVFQFIPQSFYSFGIEIIILMCAGALFGDVAGSFVKRRLKIKPGDPAFVLDQLGFLVSALAFASLVYVPDINTIAILILVTPVLHLGTNVIGYIMKIKKHPW